MSSICPQVHTMRHGHSRILMVDWGKSTAAQKTGPLAAGDSVSSVTATIIDKPSGAADLTLGTVTQPANSSSDDLNGRTWSTGEASRLTVTAASDQAYGTYRIQCRATTTNGEVFDALCDVLVEP